MPYETELQRHLDIFALSLSLKKNPITAIAELFQHLIL